MELVRYNWGEYLNVKTQQDAFRSSNGISKVWLKYLDVKL